MAFPQLPVGGLSWRHGGRVVDLALPLGFGLALLLLTPWRTAFQFNADEGFELMKALLVSQGHALYGAFWNDQPPLHTELLALLFRWFGPSAAVGRLLSVGFAVVLVAVLYGLARRCVNRWAGVVAVALLASASQFLTLSVSVMLDLPAFALGLAAVWAWYRWADGAGRHWLAVSGMLMGCALQVKFTAGLLLPAFAVAWLTGGESGGADRPGAAAPLTGRTDRSRRCRCGWGDAWLWLGCLGGAFGLVVLLYYGPGAWTMFARSHFSAGTRVAARTGGLALRPEQWLDDAGLVLLALLGLALQLKLRQRGLWFPVVWVLTALLVHWQHRPFWSYYLLHFGIPLGWLGGAGVVEGYRRIWRRFPSLGRAGWGWPAVAWFSWSLACAGGFGLALERGARELRGLRQAPPANQERHVEALRDHGHGARWVFTHDLLAAFWARLAVPPELAVIPWKRLWSGQLTPEQVRDYLGRYRPEVILLSKWRRGAFGLEDQLEADYHPVASTPGLFVRR